MLGRVSFPVLSACAHVYVLLQVLCVSAHPKRLLVETRHTSHAPGLAW